MPPAPATWLGQARAILVHAASTFGVWAEHPAMGAARELNEAVDGPTGFAKCSRALAASVLRHLARVHGTVANKDDPDWQGWQARWGRARRAVLASGAMLDKAGAWGEAGVWTLTCQAAIALSKADPVPPVLVPTPSPTDEKWLAGGGVRTSPPASAASSASDTQPEAQSGGLSTGALALLALLLLND